MRFDQGEGLSDDLRDGALPGEPSELGPGGTQVLVVLSGDLEVAGQQPGGLARVGEGGVMYQESCDLLKLAWGWGRGREESPGSVAGLDHDH